MPFQTLRLLLRVQASDRVRGQSMHTIPQRRRQFTSPLSGHKVSSQRQTTSTSKTSHIHGSSVARSVNNRDMAKPSTLLPFQRKPRSNNSSNSNNNNNSNNKNSNYGQLNSSSQTSEESTEVSQGRRYREWHQEIERQEHNQHLHNGVAASSLGPLPSQYGYYNGIDAYGWDHSIPHSLQERRQRMQETIESNALSTLEITEGGEEDVNLNGLPASEYHGQEGWTNIPMNSALYSSIIARNALDSRERTNSWMLLHPHKQKKLFSNDNEDNNTNENWKNEVVREVTSNLFNATTPSSNSERECTPILTLNEERRRIRQSEGGYSDELEEETLSTMQESIGQPRSTYGLRKLYVDGLIGYQGIITRSEEVQVNAELLKLLQNPSAAYIAEETRYCVNLYERTLGIPGKDTLAFALSMAPTLQKVLYRFYLLGLIPSPPNVCQVSEMMGNFAGYPVHRKPPSIGSYYGILNLVGTSVMYLQHTSCPWFPRLHFNPRSLIVVTEPCLSEYKIGYRLTHQPFHHFEYSTRVSKDYRIEVVFANVEMAHTTNLREAVQLTEYAEQVEQQQQQEQKEQRQITSGSEVTSKESKLSNSNYNVNVNNLNSDQHNRSHCCTDEWLSKLRDKMHAKESGSHHYHHHYATSASLINMETEQHTEKEKDSVGNNESAENIHSNTFMNGHELREQLIREHLIGSKAIPFITSLNAQHHEPLSASEKMKTRLSESETEDSVNKDNNNNNTEENSCVGQSRTQKLDTLSPARRRIAALKTRYEAAEQWQAKLRAVSREGSSSQLIRGYSPADKSEKL